MDEILQVAFGFLALGGTIAAALQKNPYSKLISLGALAGGVIPFIVDQGYLDVAIAVSLIAPVTTIFILMAMRGVDQ
jgi:energy-converting hydrogenase A subunit D